MLVSTYWRVLLVIWFTHRRSSFTRAAMPQSSMSQLRGSCGVDAIPLQCLSKLLELVWGYDSLFTYACNVAVV